jgi:hypothetical protein
MARFTPTLLAVSLLLLPGCTGLQRAQDSIDRARATTEQVKRDVKERQGADCVLTVVSTVLKAADQSPSDAKESDR